MDIRDRFTKNAEEFDALMVEMLEENDALKGRIQSALDVISEIDESDCRGTTWVSICQARCLLNQ